jgi:CheY-like chemotaxis protein
MTSLVHPFALEREEETSSAKGRALIVDDDPTNRAILEALLKREGYQTTTAIDGLQAVQFFSEVQPDIVFMDVMMPEMDGYEATTRIKALAGNRFVPVVFLTALTEDEALEKCIASGGDDFLGKPYKRAILRAKIGALVRIQDLYRTVESQHHKIERLHTQMLREQEVAEHIFSGAVTADNVALDHIRTLLRPATTFSGDLLLTAHHPAGGLHILLGDFTGHGLVAAIGALPASEVFRAMTGKGYSAPEILATINRKLHRLLPTGMFMTACFVSLRADLRTVSIWNAAMPDVLILDEKTGAVKHRAPSQFLPLGIQQNTDCHLEPAEFNITQGDRILLCSDGVIEAREPGGSRFGEARYAQAVTATHDSFQSVVSALDAFCGDRELSDDVSLVEIPCRPEVVNLHNTAPIIPDFAAQSCAKDRWRWSVELHGPSLHHVNPVPLAIGQLLEIECLGTHRHFLFTVLSELYSNALEHGILGLDSDMKSSPEGFGQYYAEREARLKKLETGFVRIELEHLPQSCSSNILIRVFDSGPGFDHERCVKPLEPNLEHSGRGVPLVQSLCKSLHFQGRGNQVEAVYALGKNQV